MRVSIDAYLLKIDANFKISAFINETTTAVAIAGNTIISSHAD